MKDFSGEIEYRGKKYKLVFDLNVMEEIQEKYETLEKWGDLTDGKKGEPNAKAIIFGFTSMLNEGIEITNEEKGTDDKPLTLKQVGRIITEYGFQAATSVLNQTIIESTKGEEKNV